MNCYLQGHCLREKQNGCQSNCTIKPEFEYLINGSNIPENLMGRVNLYAEKVDLPVFETLNKIKYDIENVVKDGRFIYLWSKNVGNGKAQPMDAQILTLDGWRNMGDLRVGNRVFAEDGVAYEITALHPQEEPQTMYELVFDDGAKCRCTLDHLWTVRLQGSYLWETHTLEYLKDLEGWQIPNCTFVNFRSRRVPVNTSDVGKALGGDATAREDVDMTGRLELNYNNPRIPEIYLYNSNVVRLQLLQGILVANGQVLRITEPFTLRTRFEGFAKDIQTLLWSMGYSCIIERERDEYVLTMQNTSTRTIVSVTELEGEFECQCITTSSPYSLYLTDDFIVTHNTVWGIKLLKTFLAVSSLGNNFKDRAFFEYVPSLILLSKEFDSARRSEHLNALVERDLVILDDIGAVNSSNYDLTILSDIIDTRYRKGKATIFTSNLSPDRLKTSLGARLADRVCSDIVLEFKGGGRRNSTSVYERRA